MDKDFEKPNMNLGDVYMPDNPGSNKNSAKLWTKVTRFQYFYSMAGLILGLVCILGGIILFFHGAAGTSSWTAKILGLESTLSDATPGVILFVVGLFIVWVTRYSVGTNKKA